MSLGRLAASVVHEINNPLSGILNYLRLMARVLKRGPLDAGRQSKFEGYLELVESETARCSRIVSNLLTFSRKSPPAVGPVDIADLIERSLILSQHKLTLSDIAVSSTIAPVLPRVEGDFNQLQQCMINLIFNAIDAMPQGGTLELTYILTVGPTRHELSGYFYGMARLKDVCGRPQRTQVNVPNGSVDMER